MHDPYVKNDDQNLLKFNQEDHFTRDLDKALKDADYILCVLSQRIY